MRADARANRDDIITSALALFGERGITAPLRAIAARAGVGVATLHRHFPDRESLVTAVADHMYAGAVAVIADHDAVWDEDPWAAWTGVVHDLAALGIAPLAASAAEFAVSADRVGAFVQLMRERDMRPIEELLDRAAAHAYAPHDLDPYRFAAGLAIVSRPPPDFTAELLPDQRDWIVGVYIDGLRARGKGV